MKASEVMVRIIPFVCGVAMSLNFVAFWAVPIMGMGLLWKHALKNILLPMYDVIDQNQSLRSFAVKYIYSKPEHADFFAMSLLTVLNSFIFVGIVFFTQLRFGFLPWWLIGIYYCSWVGIGGRIMGAAYSLAHKEGHHHTLYKKWIRDSVGNIFENCLGVLFGNVPWNFTTSHIFIHHRLDGGCGDTFYLWDFDRTSLSSFMLYITRIFSHMTGYSSLKFFRAHGHTAKADVLQKGIVVYWVTAGAILALTRSFSFLFWIYLQPLLCMSYFLALINIGYHGFLEFDESGVSIPCVNSTCIIEGDDDYFGEDDHMSHHYNTNVYFRDLKVHQATKTEEFKQYRASVFRRLSIVELSIFILLGLWDKIAEHYVDYSGTMSKEQIINMLRTRARRIETTFDEYQQYMCNPTPDNRKALVQSLDTDNDSCFARGVGLLAAGQTFRKEAAAPASSDANDAGDAAPTTASVISEGETTEEDE